MPTLTAQQTEYLELTQSLSSEELEIINQALRQFCQTTTAVDRPIVQLFTGRSFSESEHLQLEMDTLLRYFQHRRGLLAGALTTGQVAQLLGTSRQTPYDRVKAQTLLAVMENGSLRFPIWQFDPEGSDGVIAGLPATLKALQVSDFAKLNWLTRPNEVLGRLTPVQALQQGQQDAVVQEAVGVGSF